MDGSDIVTLVNIGTQKPTQLSINPNEGMLYWVDGSNGTLHRIKYDGTGNSVVWKGLGQPFGITVHKQNIFWSDLFEGTVFRSNENGPLDQKRLQYRERGTGSPKGLTVVTTDRKGGKIQKKILFFSSSLFMCAFFLYRSRRVLLW